MQPSSCAVRHPQRDLGTLTAKSELCAARDPERAVRRGADRVHPWTGRHVARDTEVMVKSVEGIYRDGKVELTEPLIEAEGSRVIVTWVHSREAVNLQERGIDSLRLPICDVA